MWEIMVILDPPFSWDVTNGLVNNKAISIIRGKSPPSEFILEIIKSNNSLRFLKQFGKGDFYFYLNIILFYFFTFILIKRAKLKLSLIKPPNRPSTKPSIDPLDKLSPRPNQ